MPDLLERIGSAAKAIAPVVTRGRFHYAPSYGSRNGISTGAYSRSNTLWLHNGRDPYPSNNTDYRAAVGNLWETSLFGIALKWQITAFIAANPIVERWEEKPGIKAQWNPDFEHPVLDVLFESNPLFTWKRLAGCLLFDDALDGNSYLVKARNALGEVVGLHWAPYWQWQPVTTTEDALNGVSISYYERTNGTAVEQWHVNDVIHLRGVLPDPGDPRKGMSLAAALLREILTDQERARFAGSMLKNSARIGGIISPAGTDVEIDDDTAAAMQVKVNEDYSGEKAGRIHVSTGHMKFEKINYSPEEMIVDKVSKIPETRVAAAFLVSPTVLNLQDGGAETKANMEKLQEASIEAAIIPLWLRYGAELTKGLLTEPQYGHRRRLGTREDDSVIYGKLKRTIRIGFDMTEVRALQPDIWKAREAAREDFTKGGLTVNEYRAELGRGFLLLEDGKPDPRGNWLFSDFMWHANAALGQNANAPEADRDAQAIIDDNDKTRLRNVSSNGKPVKDVALNGSMN